MSQKRPTPVAQPANKASISGASPQLAERRPAKALVTPIVSEKATSIAQKHNQVLFKILRDASKPEIKAAVELLFKVEVQDVTVINKKGQTKRFGGRLHRVLKPALTSKRIASEDLDAAVRSVAG